MTPRRRELAEVTVLTIVALALVGTAAWCFLHAQPDSGSVLRPVDGLEGGACDHSADEQNGAFALAVGVLVLMVAVGRGLYSSLSRWRR